jgi:hypothetical protein
MKSAYDVSTVPEYCKTAFKAVGMVPFEPKYVAEAIHNVGGLNVADAITLLRRHVERALASPGRLSHHQVREAMGAVDADVDAAVLSAPAADAGCKSMQEDATDYFKTLLEQLQEVARATRHLPGVQEKVVATSTTLLRFRQAYYAESVKTAHKLALFSEFEEWQRSEG